MIALVPHILWAAVVIAIVAWIGPGSIRSALLRLSKVGFAGLELEFRDDLKAATKAQGKTPEVGEIGRASRRLASSEALMRDARVLWVDDKPENNRFEVHLFETAGARITTATSTEEGVKKAAETTFDLVISDMARGGDATAGSTLCDELAVKSNGLPVILYVGEARKPAPPESFGITDRPGELVHLVLDVMARRRG